MSAEPSSAMVAGSGTLLCMESAVNVATIVPIVGRLQLWTADPRFAAMAKEHGVGY
jgi:hypothetical protein